MKTYLKIKMYSTENEKQNKYGNYHEKLSTAQWMIFSLIL